MHDLSNSTEVKTKNPHQLLTAVLSGTMGDFAIQFSQGEELWSEYHRDYILIGPKSVLITFKIFGQPHHAVVTKEDYLKAVCSTI